MPEKNQAIIDAKIQRALNDADRSRLQVSQALETMRRSVNDLSKLHKWEVVSRGADINRLTPLLNQAQKLRKGYANQLEDAKQNLQRASKSVDVGRTIALRSTALAAIDLAEIWLNFKVARSFLNNNTLKEFLKHKEKFAKAEQAHRLANVMAKSNEYDKAGQRDYKDATTTGFKMLGASKKIPGAGKMGGAGAVLAFINDFDKLVESKEVDFDTIVKVISLCNSSLDVLDAFCGSQTAVALGPLASALKFIKSAIELVTEISRWMDERKNQQVSAGFLESLQKNASPGDSGKVSFESLAAFTCVLANEQFNKRQLKIQQSHFGRGIRNEREAEIWVGRLKGEVEQAEREIAESKKQMIENAKICTTHCNRLLETMNVYTTAVCNLYRSIEDATKLNKADVKKKAQLHLEQLGAFWVRAQRWVMAQSVSFDPNRMPMVGAGVN